MDLFPWTLHVVTTLRWLVKWSVDSKVTAQTAQSSRFTVGNFCPKQDGIVDDGRKVYAGSAVECSARNEIEGEIANLSGLTFRRIL